MAALTNVVSFAVAWIIANQTAQRYRRRDFAFAGELVREISNTEEEIRNAWGKPEAFAEALTKAIGLAVALLNETGAFRKG